MIEEYRLKLPKTHREFDDDKLVFTINHIRSRRPSILYFILHCYRIDGSTEILVNNKPVYTSPRGVIGTMFSDEGCDYTQPFTIPSSVDIEDIYYVQLELRTLGINSENPLYFSELMFEEGTEFDGYHTPNEQSTTAHSIELPSNYYANLYDGEDNYLQVIRPNKETFATDNLPKAQYTILAPHFADEDDVDSHIAVFTEAMNQTEQRIDVLR